MGAKYRHLSEKDRAFISIMLEKRYSKTKIAHILKVDPSTIYREIKRNSITHWPSYLRYYWGFRAQQKASKRRLRGLKLEKNTALRQYVHAKLQAGWSPYQIEGRLKKDNSGQTQISHESIYHYIYSNPDRRYLLHKYLRRRHRFRTKQGQRKSRFPQGLLIASRPEYINDRSEFGHWECDLMMFKQGVKANLITLRERKSRFIVVIKNESKEATGTALALIQTIKKLKEHVKSITFDQGSEFRKYPWIKDCLDTDVYFCEPGCPYQKGTVENGNAVIRIEFPRTFDVTLLKQKLVNRITNNINNRPMKCLDYQTPAEKFSQLIEQELYEN